MGKDEAFPLFWRKLLCNGNDFFSVVVSASLANPVGRFEVAALRAFHDSGNRQLPVRSSLVAPRLRRFSFWNSHV
jgi:hypothetical protein